MNEEILLKLIVGSLFLIIIVILLIVFSLKKKKQGNKAINKVDYGQIYFQIMITTFVANVILCDDIYEFLLFQGSLILAAIVISKHANEKIGKRL